MPRVAVLDDYQHVALDMADWSVLPDDVEVAVFHDHLYAVEEIAARLQDFEIVVAMRERTPFQRELLELLPKLKLLITTGSRNRSIDVEAARELGVTVCGTGSLGYPTSELTWGLIIGLVRGIAREDAGVRAGKWQVGLGQELRGKTLGLVGLGRQGGWVAAVGKAFGMELIAWSQNLTAERAAECGATLVTKDELLSTADVVTIHLVLSDRTRGLIGERELALMKPTAYLVNTSRGPIVDELALIDVLERRAIAGAALDVFDVEPLLPDSPLLGFDNVLLSPHMGYVGEQGYRIYYVDIVEDIARFLGGDPLRVIGE